jgi:hypothetical protein
MWAWIGAAVAMAGALLGTRNARSRTTNPYAAGEYGMGRRSHARFALASAAFAVAFAGAGAFVRGAVIPLLAVYVLLLILYLTSFARGFSDQ